MPLEASIGWRHGITYACLPQEGEHPLLGGMKGQPPFNKEGKIPDWGHVDVYELSA
jgi:hypothetical protein